MANKFLVIVFVILYCIFKVESGELYKCPCVCDRDPCPRRYYCCLSLAQSRRAGPNTDTQGKGRGWNWNWNPRRYYGRY